MNNPIFDEMNIYIVVALYIPSAVMIICVLVDFMGSVKKK